MNIPLLVAFVLSFSIFGQLPVTDEPEKLPGTQSPGIEIDRLLSQIKSSDLDMRQRALQEIINNPDPDLLPVLHEILNESDAGLRRQVSMVVINAFAGQSFEFFKAAAISTGIPRREAAAHALGMISDIRVIPILQSLIADPEVRIKNAALRSLQSLVRQDLPYLFQKVAGTPQPPANSSTDTRNLARLTLNRLGQSNPGDPNLQIARIRCLDSGLAQVNRNHWLKTLDLEPDKIQKLRKFLDNEKSWLGRAKVRHSLNYKFSMLNAVSGSSKEIDITASTHDVDLLRSLGYDLDRVIHLRLVSDLFFAIPDALAPELTFDDSYVDVTFDIRNFPGRHIGIGLLNISYWETRILTGARGHLRFDAKTMRLIEESITDEAGKLLWKMEVNERFEGNDHFPRRLTVDVPGGKVGANQIHLRVDLQFQFKEGRWLLSEGSTREITAEGEDLKAYCEVVSSDDSPVDSDEAGPSSEVPVGGGEESGSGQGSSAGRP